MFFFDTAAQPSPGVPEPTLRPGLNENQVTPGIEGFLLTAVMVVFAILVLNLMIRSVRRVKLRSETAEDMLVERHQDYLSEEERERPEGDELTPDKAQLYRQKYPGYLDSPTPEPKSPDSGRDF